MKIVLWVNDPSSGHDPTSVMNQFIFLGHDRLVIKFLNTNYIFLGILGRPGHDPSSGHDPIRVTQLGS